MDKVNYTAQKAWKELRFVMSVLKKGNRNTKSLAHTSLVRPILEYGAACWDPCREGQMNALDRVQKKYGAACWDPCREGQINALDRVQKKSAQFKNHTNFSDWETLAQLRTIARLCALFKATLGNGFGKL